MIVLPAEVLTTEGFVDIKNLNLINHKICTFNSNTNVFSYERPLGIYVQPMHFRYYTIQNEFSALFLDESHDKSKVYSVGRISKNQIGSKEYWTSNNFLANATYEQCLHQLKTLFKVDNNLYSPTIEGTFETNDFAVASAVQRLAVHANLQCHLICSVDYSNIKCVLADDLQPLKCYGPYKADCNLYAVNVSTITGNYVVRVAKQTNSMETIYSTLIV